VLEFLQVAQHVEDLDRAVEFYRETFGGELLARFDPPGWLSFEPAACGSCSTRRRLRP